MENLFFEKDPERAKILNQERLEDAEKKFNQERMNENLNQGIIDEDLTRNKPLV